MKKGRKKIVLAILICMVMLVSGCGRKSEKNGNQYTVREGGRTFFIDLEQSIVQEKKNIYHFSVSGSGENVTIDIQYPNGAVYSDAGGIIGESGETGGYISGDILCKMIKNGDPSIQEQGGSYALAGILFFVLGMGILVKPRILWSVRTGWKYKNVEPSDFVLSVNRCIGIVFVIIAIAFFFR